MKYLITIFLSLLISTMCFSQAQNGKYVTVGTPLILFGGGGLANGSIVTDLSTKQTYRIDEYASPLTNLASVDKTLFDTGAVGDTSLWETTLGHTYLKSITDSVGIGTATPGSILDVAGRITISGTGRSIFIGGNCGTNDDLTDNRNVYIGEYAGRAGGNSYSVAIGFGSMMSANGVTQSSAVGMNSLSKSTGDYNSAFGYQSLQENTTGTYNSAFGNNSLALTSTGSYNTGIGADSFRYLENGSNNTVLGYMAGSYRGSATSFNVTCNNSIFIGYKSRANANDETNQIVIGHEAVGNGDSTATIGHAMKTIYMSDDGTADVKLKGIYDANNDLGTDDYVLTSHGDSAIWKVATNVTDLSGIRDTLQFHRDSLLLAFDSIAVHRTDINSLFDTVAIHLDTLQELRIDINAIEQYDPTALYDSLAVHRDSLESYHDTLVQHRIDINAIEAGTGLWEIDDAVTQLKIADEVDMQNKAIHQLLDPIDAQDAATKAYIDAVYLKTYAVDSLRSGVDTLDLDSFRNAEVYLESNSTVFLENLEEGFSGNIEVLQDGTGGYTFSITNTHTIINGLPTYITTNPDGKTIVSWYYSNGVVNINFGIQE